MTKHDAIVKIEDLLDMWEPESPEDLEQEFYTRLTIDELYECVCALNSLIRELKEIVRRVE